MRSWFYVAWAVVLAPLPAWANEIPPEQLAGLSWSLSTRTGYVGTPTPPASTLDVYDGCLTAPASLTQPYTSSKTWYVSGTDVSPAGDTPDNGADGTAAHPYNSITALFIGNSNSTWTGWSAGPRAVFGPYFQAGIGYQAVRNAATATLTLTPTVASTLGGVPIWRRNGDGALYSGAQHTASFSSPVTVTIASIEPGAWTTVSAGDTFTLVSGTTTGSFSVTTVTPGAAGQNPETYDPTHALIWPGDVIVVNGHNANWQTHTPGAGIPTELNLTNLEGLHSVDDTGATKWTLIQGGSVAPQIDEIIGSTVQGIIINGQSSANKIAVGNPNTLNATALQGQTFYMAANYETSLPTTSTQLILGPVTWSYVNTHTASDQIVLNGSFIDILYNTWNELKADATTTGLVTIGNIPGTTYGFTWKVGSTTTTVNLTSNLTWDSVNHVTTLTPNSTFVADSITWTLVTGAPLAHQVQIGTSLDGTLNNISAALIANDPSLTFGKVTGLTFSVTSKSAGPTGALPMRLTNVTTGATITKVATTMPVLFASNLALNQRNINMSGTIGMDMKDVILSNLNLGSGNIGEAYPGPTANGIPQTGSQGVDIQTGAQGSGLSWFTNSTASIPVAIPIAANPTAGSTFVVNGTTYTWSNSASSGTTVHRDPSVLLTSLENAVAQVNLNDAAAYVHLYAVGGPWNNYDFATLVRGGVSISGNYDPTLHAGKTTQNVTGAECVALENIDNHNDATVSLSNIHDSLYGPITNWMNNQDNFDLGPAYNMHLRNLNVALSLYDLSGTHSDGFQTQSGTGLVVGDIIAANFPGIADTNILIEDMDIENGQATILADKSQATLDNFGKLELLTNDGLSCLQMTWPINNSIYRNNYCATSGPVQAGPAFNTVFANNTLLRPGVPGTLDGAGVTSNVIKVEFIGATPIPTNNVYVNNLTNGLGIGATPAPLFNDPDICDGDTGDTFTHNISIPPVFDGTLQSNVQDAGFMCNASGIHSEMNSPSQINTCVDVLATGGTGQALFGSTYPQTVCGLTIGELDSTGGASNPIMQAYHPAWNNSVLDATQLNPRPPGYPSSPTGGLVCTGVMVTGVSTVNHDGNAWAGGAGCVGIGAF